MKHLLPPQTGKVVFVALFSLYIYLHNGHIRKQAKHLYQTWTNGNICKKSTSWNSNNIYLLMTRTNCFYSSKQLFSIKYKIKKFVDKSDNIYLFIHLLRTSFLHEFSTCWVNLLLCYERKRKVYYQLVLVKAIGRNHERPGSEVFKSSTSVLVEVHFCDVIHVGRTLFTQKITKKLHLNFTACIRNQDVFPLVAEGKW